MGYGLISFIALVVWGIIWGFATCAVIDNKGYGYEGTKWFWLGFFFGFIALIVAATKPECKNEVRHQVSAKEMEEKIIQNNGWKCTCGRVNYYYTTTCACGKSKFELKKQVEQPAALTEEKNDAVKIKEFKELLDAGIITQEEFDAKKKQLLGL